jgi:hypothetical protein
MPTLPPGTANNVNLSFTPTWLFTPSTSATNNVRLWNNGRNTVYVGQADVTVNTGLPIPPGGKPVELSGVTQSLYGISTYSLGTLIGTVSTASVAGATVLNFTTQATAQLSTGATVVVGSTAYTSNQEVLSITTETGTAATAVTVSTLAQFYHPTTDVVYLATATYGQISVQGGVA